MRPRELSLGMLGRAASRIAALIPALLLLVLWTGPARAQSGRFDLLADACIAAGAQDAGVSPSYVRQLDYHCRGEEPHKGDRLWLRMEPPPAARTSDGSWSILVNETRFDSARLLIERERGEAQIVTFDEPGLGRNWLLGNNVHLPIPAGESAITAIYLGVDGLPASRLLQRVELAAEPAVKSAHDSWLLLSGVFGGALAASMLYNLLLLGGVRHRLQLIYLSWMTAMLAYGLGWTGLIHYVAPGMATADVSQFTYFVAATGMAMGVIFFVEFFSEGQLPFWLERAQRVLAIMLLGAALVATYAGPALFPAVDGIVLTLVVVTQLLIAVGLLRALKRERKPATLYALGWSFPFLAVMLNILQGHASFGPGIAAHLHIFIATVLQALLLSAAAAVRLSGIRRERDTARAESERLRSLAETDPLTGLLNRRGLVHRARAIMSKEMGSALVLIDVDHFKEVNDGFGHDVGDRVLMRIGELLEQQCGSRYPVCRIGGEEFAVVLPPEAAVDAMNYADGVRRQLAGASFADLLGAGRGITISIGLAVAPASFSAVFERLYVAADHALYLAKRGGRNRVELASLEDIRRAEIRLAAV